MSNIQIFNFYIFFLFKLHLIAPEREWARSTRIWWRTCSETWKSSIFRCFLIHKVKSFIHPPNIGLHQQLFCVHIKVGIINFFINILLQSIFWTHWHWGIIKMLNIKKTKISHENKVKNIFRIHFESCTCLPSKYFSNNMKRMEMKQMNKMKWKNTFKNFNILW